MLGRIISFINFYDIHGLSCLSKLNGNKCVEFGAIDFIERIPYICRIINGKRG